MSSKIIPIIIRVEGGVADDGKMDIYDGANTSYGLARAVNMVIHSLCNNEEVKKKNKTASGAAAYTKPPMRGCFEYVVDIEFDGKIVSKIGESVFSKVFWDYLTWTWSAAVGGDYQPITPYVRKVSEKNADFIYEIRDSLEAPIELMHRAISTNENVRLFLSRPRVDENVLEFNSETLTYVTTKEETSDFEYISGNVARYSTTSQFGLLFSMEDGKVYSFSFADEKNQRVRNLAIESMKANERGEYEKYTLKVTKVLNINGVLKRYRLHDVLER